MEGAVLELLPFQAGLLLLIVVVPSVMSFTIDHIVKEQHFGASSFFVTDTC